MHKTLREEMRFMRFVGLFTDDIKVVAVPIDKQPITHNGWREVGKLAEL